MSNAIKCDRCGGFEERVTAETHLPNRHRGDFVAMNAERDEDTVANLCQSCREAAQQWLNGETGRDETVFVVEYDDIRHDRTGMVVGCPECGESLHLKFIPTNGCHKCDFGPEDVHITVNDE